MLFSFLLSYNLMFRILLSALIDAGASAHFSSESTVQLLRLSIVIRYLWK